MRYIKGTKSSKYIIPLAMIITLFLALLTGGCSDGDEYNDKYSDSYDELSPRLKRQVDQIRAYNKKKEEEERKAKEKPKHKMVKAELFKNAPLEDLSDKDSYDMPRLQFFMQIDKTERKRLFSIKIDGTDIREVIPYDKLYNGIQDMDSILKPPVRSPNNRYFVMCIIKTNRVDESVVLYDIKTQKFTAVTKKDIGVFFTWLPDSSGFYYRHAYGKNYLYDINSGKTSKLAIEDCDIEQFSGGKLICRGYQNKYIAAHINMDGTVAKGFDIKIGERDSFANHRHDINGQYFIYSLEHDDGHKRSHVGTYLYDVNQQKNIKELPKISYKIIYASVSKNLLYTFSSREIYQYSLDGIDNKKTVFEFEIIGRSYPSEVSIYNLGGLAND